MGLGAACDGIACDAVEEAARFTRAAAKPGSRYRHQRERGVAQPAAASLAMPLKRAPDSLGRPLNPGRDTINNANGVWRSLVSALVWGTRGPRFKSGHPDCMNSGIRAWRAVRPGSDSGLNVAVD